MRRRTGIVIGTCTALALIGTAGSVVSAGAGERPSEPRLSAARPSTVERNPAAVKRRAVPQVTPTTATPGVKSDISSSASAPASAVASAGARRQESTTTRSAGRQRIGELLRVDRLLGNVGGPKREEFAYPGASYVKVHFDRLTMLPGDYVTVSNPERTESYRYDESDPDGRWAMSITGDTAVVEVHREINPLGLRDVTGDLGIGIDRVARGESRPPPARPGREESVCGTDTSSDAVCYESKDPVAYTKSKATARLLINGTELCTGWRVGPKNRMITNNHCLTTSGEAYDTEVWFNYQCAKCGGYDVFKPTKVWGDQVLATDKTYDYTLFTVDGFPSIEKFGYLTLDTVRPGKGQELYVPQHPSGEPAKIAGNKGEAAGNCEVDNPDYTGYAAHSDVSYFCDTAGGSSGSPVISRATNRVVALHHFGGCPNSGVRGDLLAGRLRTYL
ncbi:serine protease [Actinoplanes hulinensis]|uniref:Serine protease n=1 Tax=Actinoplanes hulinensis TaxID=1144547 RepID=A0ABS7AVT3_9ACTN|nr:serine protease [Actinoplanes hulinensis]